MINNQRLLAFTSITLLLLIFTSCRTARFLNEDQALVDHVDIHGVKPELKETTSLYISNEIKVNSRVNLFIYNLFNTKDGKYKKRNIRNVGEAPHLLDSGLVDLSATQIKRFLFTKGYFGASVTPEIAVKKKRATIHFNVTQRDPYYMSKITYNFADPIVADLYKKEVKPATVIKEGDQYDAVNLITEREKLYMAMRDHGYFDYIRQYMRHIPSIISLLLFEILELQRKKLNRHLTASTRSISQTKQIIFV
jgi:outer membrane protein insertion porin family